MLSASCCRYRVVGFLPSLVGDSWLVVSYRAEERLSVFVVLLKSKSQDCPTLAY
jgi:hypothetical protein